MPVNLTNATKSFANVPFNRTGKPVYASVKPGETVLVSDAYLAGLDEEAKNRFHRVCAEPDPIFRAEVVDPPKVSTKGKKSDVPWENPPTEAA